MMFARRVGPAANAPTGRMGLALGAVVLSAMMTGAALAAVGSADTSRFFGAGRPILESSSSPQELSVLEVRSSAFSTVVVLTLKLPSALRSDESFAVTPEKLMATFGEGRVVMPAALAYEIGGDRDEVRVTAQFPGAANSDELRLTLGEYVVLPNDGDGRVTAANLEAVAKVDSSQVALASDLTAALPARTIDSGDGWRYVIDSVKADATTVRVQYRVEGNVDGLRSLPPLDQAGPAFLPFPDGGTPGSVELPRPTGQELRLAFGAAARPVQSPVSVAFSRGGLAAAWRAATLPSGLDATTATISEEGGFVSVRLASPRLLTGRGSPGNGATLTDNAGNSYQLYHGSGSLPVATSQWDFVGPLAPGATELTLTVPGYSTVEAVEDELLVPLP